MTRFSFLLSLIAVATLLVTIGSIYAQLLSGYTGTGVGGLTVRDDSTLRSILGLVAIAAWVASTLSSLWSLRISTGFGRTLPALTLLVSLGIFTIAIIGAIF